MQIMTIPIPEDSITINGEIYVLVDEEEEDECLRCALRHKCDMNTLLCQILDDAPQGKRFEKLDANTSPWKTVINGYPKPNTDRPVVGYYVSGPEPFIELVTHDPETNQWQDLDIGGCECHDICEPDYWLDLPEYYADKRSIKR